jgi:ribosomal protein S18 acetylase RimI-like enzyme
MGKRIYFKRYRMELDLRQPRPEAALPAGFHWLPWQNHLLELHAHVKFQCFSTELDSQVFPSLATLQGCRELMAAIATRPGFCSRATWLVATAQWQQDDHLATSRLITPDHCVATVQGLLDGSNYGGIQNLGVVPECRGMGLGRAALLKALDGFAACGAQRAFLEVTARNDNAVRMYRRLGFRCYKTIYREVELDEPSFPSAPRRELPLLVGTDP